MKYNFLGNTGLEVSEFSLGTMTFGGSGSAFFEGVGATTSTDIDRIVGRALDAGVNLVDTADVYSRGVSEELLGQALRGKRDQILISTKVHGRMMDAPNAGGQSRHHIIAGCEASLRRLGVEHLDIYHIHNFDAYTSWQECLSALSNLVDRGLVRYIGCSNLASWQLMKALSVAERERLRPFVVYQGNYNLLARDAELDILACCESEAVGFMSWSPLAGGILTGKYQAGQTGRRNRLPEQGDIDEGKERRILAEVLRVAERRSVSMSQVALNWIRAKPLVTSVILGARSFEQFDDSLRALEWNLSDDENALLDSVSEPSLYYPHWHQRQHNARRREKSGR